MNPFLILLASAALAHAITPGTETPFPHAPYPDPAVVYLPENYTPDRKFPIVFNYPGTNGSPNTRIPKAYTLGRDFVFVGLQYATKNQTKFDRDYLNRAHDMPIGNAERDLSPAFRHWWQLEAARTTAPEPPIKTQATDWASRMVAFSTTLESPLHRYLHLQRTLRDPFVAILPKDASNALRAAFKEAAADPSLKSELAFQKKYTHLVQQESSTESWQHDLTSARAYHKLYASAPDSHAGKMAALQYVRLNAVLGMVDRWNFATSSERDRAQADLAANPLPQVPLHDLRAYAQTLSDALTPFPSFK